MIAKRRTTRACIAAALSCLASVVRAHEMKFTAELDGANTSPPSASSGAADAFVEFDVDLVTMDIDLDFDGLTQNVSAAAVCGQTTTSLAGDADRAVPLPAFPGAMGGAYTHTIDLTTAASYDANFITRSGGTVSDALQSLITGVPRGRFYIRLSTSAYPDGEIRGYLRTFPDANGDFKIDTADFLAVAQHFNEFGTEMETGDFNLDFRTNALDFGEIASRFGDSFGMAEPRARSIVPEPATCVTIAAAALLSRRASRHGRFGSQ